MWKGFSTMKYLVFAALGVALAFAGNVAWAETLDFTGGGNADLIANPGNTTSTIGTGGGDWWQTAAGGGGPTANVDFSVNGIDFVATAHERADATDTDGGGGTQIFVYGDTNPDDGGLAAHTSAANAADMDNLWDYQSVTLTFDVQKTVNWGTFMNGDHNDSFDDDAEIWLSVDGGDWHKYSAAGTIFFGFSGTSFEFFNPNADAAEDNSFRFYVSTLNVTPEPGTLALFGLGGLCVAAARRRQRKASA